MNSIASMCKIWIEVIWYTQGTNDFGWVCICRIIETQNTNRQQTVSRQCCRTGPHLANGSSTKVLAYICRILIWVSLLQQENNLAATAINIFIINGHVFGRWYIFCWYINGHFCRGWYIYSWDTLSLTIKWRFFFYFRRFLNIEYTICLSCCAVMVLKLG